MVAPKHFLDLSALPKETLREILDLGKRIKTERVQVAQAAPLAGRALAMVFEKPSTRTRVSFEVGMSQLGGTALHLTNTDTQLGRGETIADTARVLSRFVDVIMLRTDAHEKLLELAKYADVPVINGLTDLSHPCQLMADIMTIEEHRGPIAGKTVVWVGDGNNMANSFIEAAAQFDFTLRLACPASMQPDADVLAWARARGADIHPGTDVTAAVDGADVVVTDTWVSMGQADAEDRITALTPYRVDEALMARAAADALFLHCLPAHRGDEVTDAVMDGPQSVVWDEAENRLHAQKGILSWCLS